MPRFLTETELREIYGEVVIDRLADRDSDGTVDSGVVEDAIDRAENEALSRLLNRFTDDELPADTTEASDYLKEQVAGLTYYRLHKNFDVVPTKAISERDDARTNLDMIVRGQLSVVLTDAPAVDTARPVVVVIKRSSGLYEQPMTLSSMDRMGHE
jgi:phage gp36-like protein